MPAHSIGPELVTVDLAVKGLFAISGRIRDGAEGTVHLVFTVRADNQLILPALRDSAEVYGSSYSRHGVLADFLGQFELVIPVSSADVAPRLTGEHACALFELMLISATRDREKPAEPPSA